MVRVYHTYMVGHSGSMVWSLLVPGNNVIAMEHSMFCRFEVVKSMVVSSNNHASSIIWSSLHKARYMVCSFSSVSSFHVIVWLCLMSSTREENSYQVLNPHMTKRLRDVSSRLFCSLYSKALENSSLVTSLAKLALVMVLEFTFWSGGLCHIMLLPKYFGDTNSKSEHWLSIDTWNTWWRKRLISGEYKLSPTVLVLTCVDLSIVAFAVETWMCLQRGWFSFQGLHRRWCIQHVALCYHRVTILLC
jgi:hypothetical protein